MREQTETCEDREKQVSTSLQVLVFSPPVARERAERSSALESTQMLEPWSRGVRVCAGAHGCHAPSAAALSTALDTWWSRPVRRYSRCDCSRAVNLNWTLKLFACTKSSGLEEMKLADLSTALGVTNGVFLEMGGHDGRTQTNTQYLETCLHWRGVLIEADQWAFRDLRVNRPQTLAVRAAACATHSSLPMFTRNRAFEAGRITNRLGETITTFDASSTVATVVSTGDHAHKWVRLNKSATVERVEVPCGPLSAFLRLLRIGRITVWFLDVEGAEELTLDTFDWKAVDVGLISVEFAVAAKKKNRRVLDMLARQGFVLSVCVSIWRNHIYDLVFLRAAHFVGEGRPLPAAALEWLDQPEHRLPTKKGDRCPRAGGSSAPYALLPPKILGIP